LEPLNVLIGANTSGKSNLLEALKLLKSTAGDLNAPIIEGGGIDEWIWQGAVADDSTGLEVVLPYPTGFLSRTASSGTVVR
jgi:predicted ATPase